MQTEPAGTSFALPPAQWAGYDSAIMASRIERGRATRRAQRGERLASALRANLRKRKEQARARSQADAQDERADTAHDSAGIVTDKAGDRR